MFAFLHAMSVYELILKQLNTDSFHELSHDAVSQIKKNIQRNQGYIPAVSPLAQSTTLPFDFDPSSDEEAPDEPPPDVSRGDNFEDAREPPPPDASPTASYTESLMSRIKDAADSVKRGARNVFVAGLGTRPTKLSRIWQNIL